MTFKSLLYFFPFGVMSLIGANAIHKFQKEQRDENFKPRGRKQLEDLKMYAIDMKKNNVHSETISDTVVKCADEITSEYKLTQEEKMIAIKKALESIQN